MRMALAAGDRKSLTETLRTRLVIIATQYRSFALLVLIGIFALVFSLKYPRYFPTYGNISAVLLSMSLEAIVVVAMAMLLISGEIDLSIGWNMSLAGIICGHLIMYEKLSVLPAILITLAISVLMGLLNGVLVANVGVNSFIATLATGLLFYGLSLMFAQGDGIINLPAEFTVLGQEKFLKLQIPVWYAVIIIAVFVYLMSRTTMFRQYYYIGLNKNAATLCGINVKRLKTILFIIASLLASFAGIISAARYGGAMVLVGQGMEMKAATAAIVGGVSFTGGVGTVVGAMIGELFMALLNNSLIIGEVNAYWQQILVGVVLVVAVISDALLSRRRI